MVCFKNDGCKNCGHAIDDRYHVVYCEEMKCEMPMDEYCLSWTEKEETEE